VKSAFILTDLEGVAGVVTFYEQTSRGEPYYEQARRLLTGEINAAVDALADAGVQRVLVSDAHGPGGVDFETLHDRAELIHGRPITVAQMLGPAEACDAVLVVGQHAMAGGAEANLAHTFASRTIDWERLNGRSVGEIAVTALYFGALGKPVIFLSGDDAACREAEDTVPGIVTAAVKHGLGRNCAISVSIAESHRRIREGVAAAVRKHREQPIAPLTWPGPFVYERRYFHTDAADQAARNPRLERVDGQTVRIRGENILDVLYQLR